MLPDYPRQSAAVKTGVNKCRSQRQRLQQKTKTFCPIPCSHRTACPASAVVAGQVNAAQDLRDGAQRRGYNKKIIPAAAQEIPETAHNAVATADAETKMPCRGSRIGCVFG
jgi:hypothetical protein